MNASYLAAKKIALGLKKEPEISTGDNMWNISLDGGFSFNADMPFQFFERGFDAPDEQTAQRSALMLFEEDYSEDKNNAEEQLNSLIQLLQTNNANGLQSLLKANPPEEWLSLIFLDGSMLKSILLPLLDNAAPDCKSIVADSLNKALTRLVNFQDLIKVLKDHC